MGSSFVQRGDSTVVGVLFGHTVQQQKSCMVAKTWFDSAFTDPTIVRARPHLRFAPLLPSRAPPSYFAPLLTSRAPQMLTSFLCSRIDCAHTNTKNTKFEFEKSRDPSISSPLVVHRRTDHEKSSLASACPAQLESEIRCAAYVCPPQH